MYSMEQGRKGGLAKDRSAYYCTVYGGVSDMRRNVFFWVSLARLGDPDQKERHYQLALISFPCKKRYPHIQELDKDYHTQILIIFLVVFTVHKNKSN